MMAEFIPDASKFTSLKNKVVVLTGGATGIGAATVTRLHSAGAFVVFGDINTQAAEELIKNLTASSSSDQDISFIPCDVANYSDIYALFKHAYDKHARIDHAFACAGIFETGSWFDPELTIETVKDEKGPQATLDINVLGLANSARVAVVFMREGLQKGEEDKSLTFMSSVNAFRESPGLYMYQTSKHAVQGLMRAMRKPIYEREGIRVNTVNPGVTETPMTEGIVRVFKGEGFFWQRADDVARVVLGVMVRADWNGKGVYVEGGRGWEFEESFYREQPRWLGEEPTRRMRANTEAVNKVSGDDLFEVEAVLTKAAGCVDKEVVSSEVVCCSSKCRWWPPALSRSHPRQWSPQLACCTAISQLKTFPLHPSTRKRSSPTRQELTAQLTTRTVS